MRISILLTVLAVATLHASALYMDQTDPFNLVILSQNQTINGTKLVVCHEGPKDEALCLGGRAVSGNFPFKLNYTSSIPIDPVIGKVGFINYVWKNVEMAFSQSMSFFQTTGNLFMPMFRDQHFNEVAIQHDGKLVVTGQEIQKSDDPITDAVRTVYSWWWACMNKDPHEIWGWWYYHTLSFEGDDGVPINPTCQKVEVIAVF